MVRIVTAAVQPPDTEALSCSVDAFLPLLEPAFVLARAVCAPPLSENTDVRSHALQALDLAACGRAVALRLDAIAGARQPGFAGSTAHLCQLANATAALFALMHMLASDDATARAVLEVMIEHQVRLFQSCRARGCKTDARSTPSRLQGLWSLVAHCLAAPSTDTTAAALSVLSTAAVVNIAAIDTKACVWALCFHSHLSLSDLSPISWLQDCHGHPPGARGRLAFARLAPPALCLSRRPAARPSFRRA